jgi:hypothetical protein
LTKLKTEKNGVILVNKKQLGGIQLLADKDWDSNS